MLNLTVKGTAVIFKALSDETRLKIIKIMAARGNNLCVGAIASMLGVSQPAVSQHLKVLKNAGLVEANRDGFHVHYTIVGDSLKSYGIDIKSLLKTFGAEFDSGSSCCNTDNKNQCK
ncbi:MAG: winged helix-turn-helix transcriptional regulator [Deltaproteobacteria bacterium]|nr:winged helix-turn-helix transcriptional regulator [Deltaproteobacteria bacterium]